MTVPVFVAGGPAPDILRGRIRRVRGEGAPLQDGALKHKTRGVARPAALSRLARPPYTLTPAPLSSGRGARHKRANPGPRADQKSAARSGSILRRRRS